MEKFEFSKNKKIVVGAIVVVAVAAVSSFFLYSQNIKKMKSVVEVETIYNGISINDISIGGLTSEEARDTVNNKIQKPFDSKAVTIKFNDKSWDIPYNSFDAKFDVDSAVAEAYSIGRIGTLKERYSIINRLGKNNENINCLYTYDTDKIKSQIEVVAKELNLEPLDSTMTRNNGKFVITDEQVGYTVDEEKTLEKFLDMAEKRETGILEPVLQETKPAITREQNEKATTLIGTFYTTFSSGVAGRNENLRVGSQNIDGTLLKPGDIFSMNKELGPQTYENGYRDAAVIVNGKLEDGLGGGVCQITTTLYNAVIFAELEVVERRNHSLMVGYVPLGRDAAIAGDYTDFKFKNNTEYPVYVEAYLSGNKLITNIYGNEIHSPGRTVEFEKVFLETIPKPAEKITKDAELTDGERKVTYEGKTGAKVSTYKKVYQEGALLSREFFTNSTYKATADEVTVGTKPKETNTAETNTQTNNSETKPVDGTPEPNTELSDNAPIGS